MQLPHTFSPVNLLRQCFSNARTGNNANLCDNGASTCKPENKIGNRVLVIAIVVPIAVATLLFLVAFFMLRRMKNKQGNIS